MKIILGSASKDKKEILRKAFEQLHVKAEIESVKVDSGITDQPLDKETTLQGAKNRAGNATKFNPNADLWVGLEGGLHDYGEGYHLVTFACLVDSAGKELIGKGTEVHCPYST